MLCDGGGCFPLRRWAKLCALGITASAQRRLLAWKARSTKAAARSARVKESSHDCCIALLSFWSLPVLKKKRKEKRKKRGFQSSWQQHIRRAHSGSEPPRVQQGSHGSESVPRRRRRMATAVAAGSREDVRRLRPRAAS